MKCWWKCRATGTSVHCLYELPTAAQQYDLKCGSWQWHVNISQFQWDRSPCVAGLSPLQGANQDAHWVCGLTWGLSRAGSVSKLTCLLAMKNIQFFMGSWTGGHISCCLWTWSCPWGNTVTSIPSPLSFSIRKEQVTHPTHSQREGSH